MFGRRARSQSLPEPGFGIGAQVHVVDSLEDPGSPFPDGPTGIIVRAGGSAWQPVSVIGGSSRVWTVQFDVPQYTPQLEGPIAVAQLPERQLRLAPPVDY